MTTRRSAQPKYDVSGVEVTTDEIATAIETLVVPNGIMVRQPLAKAGRALAAWKYHAVANWPARPCRLRSPRPSPPPNCPGVARRAHGRARPCRPSPVGVADFPGGSRDR